jgi:hypothetical protein
MNLQEDQSMTLQEFLAADANLHAREELFNHRLLYDLKHAAFVRGYHLLTYASGVDHDGFDVVFDDRDVLRKVQLKTVSGEAVTGKWEIHRHILRPTPMHVEGFGFPSDSPNGVEGGVILIEFKVKDDGETIDVKYFYTELSVIAGISLGLILRPSQTVNAAKNIFKSIMVGNSNDKIGVARGLFLPAASPHNLMCLLGLNGIIHRNWQQRIYAISYEAVGPTGMTPDETIRVYRETVYDLLKEVCGCTEP